MLADSQRMQEVARPTEKTALLARANSHRRFPGQQPDPQSQLSLLILVGFGAIMLLFASYRSGPHHGGLPLSQVNMLGLPHEYGTSSSCRSFQEVAKEMVPSWYQKMLSELHVLTHQVRPDEVYRVRKTILKTRDLLDVFSPTYPNATGQGTCSDIWRCLRHYVAKLYRSIGDFQDLHNCHIRYSRSQMEHRQKVVVKWATKFESYLRKNPSLPQYLSQPTAYSYAHKDSHLFWQSVDRMPRGSERITPVLQRLGSQQVRRAFWYLGEAISFQSIRNETVHEIFHNFRKELRSITDEYDLFSSLFVPSSDEYPWKETVSAIKMLKSARTHLGHINDDWTKLRFYEANDKYPLERRILTHSIDVGWMRFEGWARDANLTGVLHYLAGVLQVPKSDTPVDSLERLSLPTFLAFRKKLPTVHFVIGNQAGDADSIISAISLAYIESISQHREKTPIVAIPEADLESQRPEVKLLLELAGIVDPAKLLLFVDDPIFARSAYGADITLVDHNVVSEKFRKNKWIVSEIVDHHEDVGKYLDSCNGTERTIGFAKGRALVASACTLVAERLRQTRASTYPGSLALILMGTILLDSVNLSDEVGKVTLRDRNAVQDLISHTDWQDLPPHSRVLLGMNSSSTTPDPTALYTLLQDAKYDIAFWHFLSVGDALRLDYKQFATGKKGAFGISSILTPMKNFWGKSGVISGIQNYMKDRNLTFLAIMFAYESPQGHLKRQLAVCGTDVAPIDEISKFLMQSVNEEESLELKEVNGDLIADGSHGLTVRLFEQQNVKPSRKQIGPLLQGFLASYSDKTGL